MTCSGDGHSYCQELSPVFWRNQYIEHYKYGVLDRHAMPVLLHLDQLFSHLVQEVCIYATKSNLLIAHLTPRHSIVSGAQNH